MVDWDWPVLSLSVDSLINDAWLTKWWSNVLVDKTELCIVCYIFIIIILASYMSYLSNRGKDSQGEEIIKPYTPTTLDCDVGYFELVIKVFIYSSFEVICTEYTSTLLALTKRILSTFFFLQKVSYFGFWFVIDVSPRKNVTPFPWDACWRSSCCQGTKGTCFIA